MCRIAGFASEKLVSESLKVAVSKMAELMQQGGPDDADTKILPDGKGIFAHRRLAIIDLSAGGHQPMQYENGRYCITYNGEIYNFRELRKELIQYGCVFRTDSDTEVIMAAYHQWGIAAFEKLKGMYAFGLYDQHTSTILLVRDPAGIKPLYYACINKQLFFASEVQAFRSAPGFNEERSDWPVYLLAYGHLPEPITTLKEVKPVPKGTVIVYRTTDGNLSETAFERFIYLEKISHEREAVALIRRQLEAAVERHLVADAPIGVFLSGGVDSGIIALLAAAVGRLKLNTLSIFFPENDFSEKSFQDELVKQIQSNHHAFMLTREDFDTGLPAAIAAMDLPSCDGINTWFISRFARNCGLKAVLSGIGGDELLGGYPSFSRIKLSLLLSRLPCSLLRKTGNLNGKFKRACYLSIPGAVGHYLFLRGHFIPREIARILHCNEAEVWEKLETCPVFPDISHLTPGNQASWLETNMYMQNQLLRDADVMGMANGIEIRVPFLDNAFLHTVLSIQSNIKYLQSPSKFLLVDAFRDVLPQSIWNRPKMGFTFPFKEWFSHEQYAEAACRPDYHEALRAGRLHFSQFFILMQLHRNGRI